MEPFLGEIRAFGFGRIPRGWTACDGSLLPIAPNQALFALLGVRYGGNGTTTFGVPDLRGRAPLGCGASAGGSIDLGSRGGSETVALAPSHLPVHGHIVYGCADAASTAAPNTAALATLPAGVNAYAAPAQGMALAASAVSSAGGNQPHDNMQPSLAVNFCMATQGVVPERG